ncbi:MAG: dipeptidase [Holophaga sp.]|nr:dipeptidase [Holophaga sp.]
MRALPCLMTALSLTLLAKTPDAITRRALKLHHRLLTVDTHCDTPMRLGGTWDIGVRHEPNTRGSGCQDFPRMKEGGLTASFFAVFVGQGPRTVEGDAKAKRKALTQLDHLDAMFGQHKAQAELATTAADARRIRLTTKRAIFLGLENGYPLGQEVANVDVFFQRGIRYITLAHTADNDLCDSSTDEKDPLDRGLSALGAKVVQRMNQLGMMVDVSHISEKSFYDVMALTKAPVLASHSCARAVCDHPRNLTDDQLRALKKNGGVIQLCILSDYIKASPKNSERDKLQQALYQKARALGGWDNIKDPKVLAELEQEWEDMENSYPNDKATIKDAVDHIDHIVKVIGIDYVGIGTDFDGGGGLRDCTNVTQLPDITVELVRRGYSDKAIAKIWGGNILRVMTAVERLAVVKS